MLSFLSCIAVSIVASSLTIVPAAAHRSRTLAAAYTAVQGELRTSSVPILLPTQLPHAAGIVRSVSVLDAERAGYSVGFSTLAQCHGALSCAHVHVSAYASSSVAGRAFGSARPVRLPDGTQAFYSPRDCSGASCTEAALTFRRNHTIYELDAKVAPNDLVVLQQIYAALHCVGPTDRICQGR